MHTGEIRDQRLSASKIFAPLGWREIETARRGDQRLSASKIFALALADYRNERRRVINAFRHQRFLHTASAACRALSSLGDQRLSASKIFAP